MLIEALRYTIASEETDMNKTFKAAIAAAALIGAASGARADLTIGGAVGLPLNPTAQIPEKGGVRLQANYYDQGDVKGGGATLGTKNYGIFAAGRVADNIEISGGFEQAKYDASGFVLPDEKESGFALGAKYLFTKESDPAGVRIAAGVGYNKVQLRDTFAYVVASKYLGDVTEGKVPITGHLGLRYDRFKNSFLANQFGVAATSENKVSVYAGVEVPFSNGFAAVGEVQSKRIDGGDMPYSVSVRYRPKGSPVGGSIGWQRAGVGFGGVDPKGGLFAQLGYTFDTRGK